MNKPSLTIAAAQISVVRGDIAGNLQVHITAIHKAHAEGVHFLLFPELSLTGYEPELASALALATHDPILQPLSALAQKTGMTLVVGAPVKGERLPYIGAFVFDPSGAVNCYRKMFLHGGEDIYFSAGNAHLIIEVQGQRVLNAICADTTHSEHAAAAIVQRANIYAAGVLITEAGYKSDTELMQKYAVDYQLLVLMANYCGVTGSWTSAGGSAAWSAKGLLASANALAPGLVLASIKDGDWVGRFVAL